MDEKLFDIVYLVVIVIAAIITRYLVPLIQTKIDDTKFLELKSFIRKCIAWAETAINGSGMGADKFDLVLEKVTSWINDRGIKLSEEQARILIQGIFAEADGVTVNTNKDDSDYF